MLEREIRVSPEEAGSGILALLSRRFVNESKTRLRRLVACGQIRINGRAVGTGTRAWQGDSVSLPGDVDTEPPRAPRFPLEVLHEDDDHLVINKPHGRPVLARGGVRGESLCAALTAHVNQDSPAGGPYVRPHLVHRLDRGTSGALIVAKNEAAGRALSLQFQHRQVEKTYLAVVEGALPRREVTVDIPMRRSASSTLKMTTDQRRGKHAVTQLIVKQAFGHFSLLEVHPLTGRQHQIRVHLAAIGYPLAVDAVYGRRDRLTGAQFNEIVGGGRARAGDLLLGRSPLHARAIAYRHPTVGSWMEVTAPVPDDMVDFLKLLEGLDEGRSPTAGPAGAAAGEESH